MTNTNMAFVCALSALSVFSAGAASAQDINANWFTHFEYDSSDAAETADREFEWGEYVEDSETNQLVMSAMMERLGVSLALASSATEGFDVLKETAFNVIITDIQMPEHSVLDLLQWIQESPGIPTDSRIFACTANAGSDAVKEFEAAGFEGVLTKPLDLQALEKFLASL